MNKIILLETGFNFALIEALSQFMQKQLIQSGIDLLLMLFCTLISRFLIAKMEKRLSPIGKKLYQYFSNKISSVIKSTKK